MKTRCRSYRAKINTSEFRDEIKREFRNVADDNPIDFIIKRTSFIFVVLDDVFIKHINLQIFLDFLN
ncbi:hypothetical protein STEG23_035290 [Scotinomys teguina]